MLICGVDEAGRGALAGVVVAAAVMFGKDIPEGLDDSKKLSDKKRRLLYDEIIDLCLCYTIATASVEEIEQYNIRNASSFAMQRAVSTIVICPDIVQVDGNYCPDLPYPAEAIIGGDAIVPAIMAASIIAKVHRDNLMIKLDKQYPQYGFAIHKAYPTADHIQKIQQHGICAEHRKTFGPVRDVLNNIDTKTSPSQ